VAVAQKLETQKTENEARACGVSCQRRHHNDTESVELQMRKQCNNNYGNNNGVKVQSGKMLEVQGMRGKTNSENAKRMCK